MKPAYLIGVEILTPEHKLIDYGILEAKTGSLTLITTKFKGTILGGGILLLFSTVYWFLIAVPFVFLHVAPITQWNPALAALFVIAVPATFFAVLFSSKGLVLRTQVKYRKSSREVTVSDIQPGRFSQVMTVQSDTGSVVLMASCKRAKFEDAMTLAGQLNV